jgi:osmotically-inducible protein OsmY
MNIKSMAIIMSISILLQSCIFVAGAAAGAAAIAVVYDHRTLQSSLEDQQLANKAAKKMKLIASLRDESHIEVTTFNHTALLTGETPNPEWRKEAEHLTISIPGISRVYNQITIQGPTSSLTRASDAWITAKIKSQMLAMQNLKSSSIKVVTENGTVYLMGSVTHQQADIAVDIARQAAGVQKVVKIFQYRN